MQRDTVGAGKPEHLRVVEAFNARDGQRDKRLRPILRPPCNVPCDGVQHIGDELRKRGHCTMGIARPMSLPVNLVTHISRLGFAFEATHIAGPRAY